MTAPESEVAVRFLDETLVIVSKPGSLLVHRSPLSRERDVLLTRVRDQLGQHLYPVHRLDRATSGLILFALSSETARHLQEHWRDEENDKRYVGLVRGEPRESFSSDRPLTRHDDGVRQEAHTDFGCLATDRGFSLISAELRTGRRHQIRRHLAHLGHQLVGDTSYGKGRINQWLREEFALPRLFLHSARLTFRHPLTGHLLTIADHAPSDLGDFIRRFSPALAAAFFAEFTAPEFTAPE